MLASRGSIEWNIDLDDDLETILEYLSSVRVFCYSKDSQKEES